jgi:hypothetical protein
MRLNTLSTSAPAGAQLLGRHGDFRSGALIACAGCVRPVHEADAEPLGWGFQSDGAGELLPFCALCTYFEFRPDARAPTDI